MKRRRKPDHAERRFHIAIADYLARALPERCGAEWTHFPAGELRTAATAALLQRMGLKPGWPDFVLLHAGRVYGIEVKAKGGDLSESQCERFPRLQAAGMPIGLAYRLEDVQDFLERNAFPLKARLS